jgi:hypothetical protein
LVDFTQNDNDPGFVLDTICCESKKSHIKYKELSYFQFYKLLESTAIKVLYMVVTGNEGRGELNSLYSRRTKITRLHALLILRETAGPNLTFQ